MLILHIRYICIKRIIEKFYFFKSTLIYSLMEILQDASNFANFAQYTAGKNKIEKYFQKRVLDQQINLWNDSSRWTGSLKLDFCDDHVVLSISTKVEQESFWPNIWLIFQSFTSHEEQVSSTLKNHPKWWQKIKKSFWKLGPSL